MKLNVDVGYRDPFPAMKHMKELIRITQGFLRVKIFRRFSDFVQLLSITCLNCTVFDTDSGYVLWIRGSCRTNTQVTFENNTQSCSQNVCELIATCRNWDWLGESCWLVKKLGGGYKLELVCWSITRLGCWYMHLTT